MQNQKILLSKAILKNSLIKLLKERPLDKISVTLLCKTAGLNRSTFYAYYQDVQDLMDEMVDEFVEEIPILYQRMSDQEILEKVNKYTKFLEENRDAFFAVVKYGDMEEKFTVLWKEQQLEYYNRDFSMVNAKMQEHFTLLCTFIVNGLTALYSDWLQNEKYISSDDVAQMILDIFRIAREI